jgi:gamma-glutamyltranspeptidase/glutathione hydrolase
MHQKQIRAEKRCLWTIVTLAYLTLFSGTAIAQIAGQTATARHGMVASASGLASQVGVDILKRGGNAVDAAAAVGLALAVTYPQAGNLGGGGFMVIRLADGTATTIDYRETAPLKALRTMYMDKAGDLIPKASLVGYKAVGVPGTVAGLALAQRKYGRLKWRDVVEPARHLAAEGFVVSPRFARSLQGAADTLGQFPASRRIFLKSGTFLQPGEWFRQPELAQTLARLEADGPQEFYTGKTARLLTADMSAHGGLVTREDLARYHAVERKPLIGTYHGCGIITMPPPSSGGVALIEMLNILKHYDLAKLGFNTVATDHLLIEAMRRAFADRSQFGGDPDFVRVPVQGLISQAYADKLAATIDPDKATPSVQIGHGEPAAYESAETTQFSVVDAQGNAVSSTYTLNFSYGCGVTVPGAGFLLNDEMDDFASKPGTPNGFGLIQGTNNAIAPHKRPLSSMTPTILTRSGRTFLVTGSPGGPTIINTTLQVILNVVDHGMTLPEAVRAPRLHHQWLPDQIRYEPDALSPDVKSGLEAQGHVFASAPGAIGVSRWGDAESVLIDPKTGLRQGASDPRNADARAVGY